MNSLFTSFTACMTGLKDGSEETLSAETGMSGPARAVSLLLVHTTDYILT